MANHDLHCELNIRWTGPGLNQVFVSRHCHGQGSCFVLLCSVGSCEVEDSHDDRRPVEHLVADETIIAPLVGKRHKGSCYVVFSQALNSFLLQVLHGQPLNSPLAINPCLKLPSMHLALTFVYTLFPILVLAGKTHRTSTFRTRHVRRADVPNVERSDNITGSYTPSSVSYTPSSASYTSSSASYTPSSASYNTSPLSTNPPYNVQFHYEGEDFFRYVVTASELPHIGAD